jgi:DNA replication protein DnaC
MSTASITNCATTTTVTTTSARLGMMLTDLRLPTIKRLAGDLCARQSDLEGRPAHRLLEALLEHEINEREVRRIDRHRTESGLSLAKRLSSFDFSAVPSVSKAQVMALTEGTQWIDRGANVLLFGPPGMGKSHLVSALGHALINARRRILFTRCADLVQPLQAARRDLRLPQELAQLDRFDLLILDDLSYLRRDQAETSVLFELISERYERKSLAITANTPFSQSGEVFVEPAMTLAAVDRLVHHSTMYEFRLRAALLKPASIKHTDSLPIHQPGIEKCQRGTPVSTAVNGGFQIFLITFCAPEGSDVGSRPEGAIH